MGSAASSLFISPDCGMAVNKNSNCNSYGFDVSLTTMNETRNFVIPLILYVTYDKEPKLNLFLRTKNKDVSSVVLNKIKLIADSREDFILCW